MNHANLPPYKKRRILSPSQLDMVCMLAEQFSQAQLTTTHPKHKEALETITKWLRSHKPETVQTMIDMPDSMYQLYVKSALVGITTYIDENDQQHENRNEHRDAYIAVLNWLGGNDRLAVNPTPQRTKTIDKPSGSTGTRPVGTQPEGILQHTARNIKDLFFS